MNRVFNNGRLSTPSAFNPLAIAQRGQQGVQAASGVFEAEAKAEQEEDRAANFDASVESVRAENETRDAVSNTLSQTDESGTGFAKLAEQAEEKVYQAARTRLQDNPLALKKFDKKRILEKEVSKGAFQDTEREIRRQYQQGQILRNEDDAAQEVGQSPQAVNPQPYRGQILHGVQNSLDGSEARATTTRNAPVSGEITKGIAAGGTGAIRNLPLATDFQKKLSGVVSTLGPEWDVQLTSTGQMSIAKARELGAKQKILPNGKKSKEWFLNGVAVRTGSTRHDVDENGEAHTADLFLTKNGRVIKSKDNPAIYEKFLETAAGVFPGVGAYGPTGHIHVGAGSETHWGVNERQRNAVLRGRKNKNPLHYAGSEIPVYNGPLPDFDKNPFFEESLKRNGDVIEASDLSGPEKAERLRNLRSRLVRSAFNKLSKQNPAEALALLKSGKYNKDLTEGQANALESKAQADIETSLRDAQKVKDQKIKEIESQIKAQAKADNAIFKDDSNEHLRNIIAFHQNPNSGVAQPAAATPEQLAVGDAGLVRQAQSAEFVGQTTHASNAVPLEQTAIAEERQAILDNDSINLQVKQDGLKAFDEVIEARTKVANTNRAIDVAAGNGLQPPVNNKDVKKELDNRFAEAVAGENPSEAINDFVQQYKYIPDSFGSIVAGALNGDNVEAKRGVIETVGQLHRDHPVKLSDNKSPAIDKALAIETYLQKGVQFEDALKLANDLEAPINPTLAAGRKQVWNQKVDKKTMGDRAWEKMSENLNKVSDDGIFMDSFAGLPETAWAEYSDLARDKFVQTGDFDVAVNVAQRAFLGRHAITGVGGARRWQKDAPERRYTVYGDERDTAWIQADAIEHAKKEFPNAQGITLRPVVGSYRDDQPEYHVFTTNDGVVSVVSEPFIPNAEAERVMADDEISGDIGGAISKAKALNAQAKVDSAVTELQRLRMRVGRSPISREANQDLLDEAEKKVRDLESNAAPFLEKEAKRKAATWDRIKNRINSAFETLGEGVLQGGLSSQ